MKKKSIYLFKSVPEIFVLQKVMYKIYSVLKHPSLFITGASLCRYEKQDSIKIPFLRRNKNLLGSMAFGPISTGAECAAFFPFGKVIVSKGLAIKGIVNAGRFEINKPFRSDITFRPEVLDIESIFEGVWIKKSVEVQVCAFDVNDEVVGAFYFEVALKKRDCNEI